MEIDIGVGGRFHADQMFDGLQGACHSVSLFTSYPPSRFPNVPSANIYSFLWPEIVFRGLSKLGFENQGDLAKMVSFGQRMAKAIEERKKTADFFFGWSSFSLETLRLRAAKNTVVLRDSAHIQFQNRILQEEYQRLNVPYPDRSLCEGRELEEYSLADTIFVLSDFAKRTFVSAGIPEDKIHKLPLAVDLSRFKPIAKQVSQGPLKILYFGNLSIQKGVHHLLEATQALSPSEAELTLIGAMDRQLLPICRKYSHAKILPAMPQAELAKVIPHFDLFVFPTLHDGFGQTLLQAMACGLVPIVSNHCGAADHVKSGENGWVFPAGDVTVLKNLLREVISQPDKLPALARKAVQSAGGRPWSAYQSDLNTWIETRISGSVQKLRDAASAH